jgi:signal transduction histidine kinase
MSQRFSPWLRALYVLAWLPFLALYLFAFTASGEAGPAAALVVGLYYIVPPAVLGVAVIRLSLRTPWPGRHAARFFARHVALALLFAVAGATLTILCITQLPMPIKEYEQGSQAMAGVFAGQVFFGLLFYCIIVGFTYAAMGEIRSRQQAAAAARAETLRARAELEALRAQVNPHFLFNTLHTLLALVRRDARAAEEALEQFGDLMRYALRVQQDAEDEVALAEEWSFARDYLALEKLRLGDRLRVHTEIEDAALSRAIPTFALQSLLENAIRHGIAPRARGGNVWVRAVVDGERLVLEVRDDGPGASEQAIAASAGTGLRLLRRRLEALHGDRATLTTATRDGGFAVLLTVPSRDGATAAGEDGR